MNEPGSRCATHSGSAASFTCPRCGAFGCVDCERRVTADTAPFCPACWAREARPVAAQGSGTALQTTALVLGIVSIIPCCPLSIASLVVGIFALVYAKEPPARDVRWRPIVGIGLTVVFGLAQVAFFASMAARPH
jgi:hypothetical protein